MKRNIHPAYNKIDPEDRGKVDAFIKETEQNGGLAPVETVRFWKENEEARKKPFNLPGGIVPFGASLTPECVFAELGIPEDFRRQARDPEWRVQIHRQYNDKAEEIVGRRLINESVPDPEDSYPERGGLHTLFEAENVWKDQSWWLMQSADNPPELKQLLDRVENRLESPEYRGVKDLILPDAWEDARNRLLPRGIRPAPYRGQRGPITFAMSVYGVENLIFLIMDKPELAERFRDLILRGMSAIAEIIDREAGYDDPPRGFGFADDNCAMLNLEMYEFFGLPILEGIFNRFSPGPEDRRYQHSDSDMAHLLPALAKVRLNGTNFGPTVTVSDIRDYLPEAVIAGQLAPFTYSRNDLPNLGAEFFRDFRQAEEKRGLVIATAGSINNGTRLTTMRFLMGLMQRYGRYKSANPGQLLL
ncbi:MAG: uroporphyrinogen decarboxylase family protein [Spirochaetia bacterium]